MEVGTGVTCQRGVLLGVGVLHIAKLEVKFKTSMALVPTYSVQLRPGFNKLAQRPVQAL